jgi:hypothetical protein
MTVVGKVVCHSQIQEEEACRAPKGSTRMRRESFSRAFVVALLGKDGGVG